MSTTITESINTKLLGPLLVKDAEQGAVEAVVCSVNVVDHEQDVVLPGAIKDGARVKLSSYGHSAVFGDAPVGKGVVHVENDRAILRAQFFLTTQRGRESFETMKALGPDSEWSIGFVPTKLGEMTDEWRAKGARRLLAAIDLFECSPVLRGASPSTMTLALKEADGEAAIEQIIADIERREAWLAAMEAERSIYPPRKQPAYLAPGGVHSDLEASEVKAYSDPLFPQWKLDAADWGQQWVLKKVFPYRRPGQPPPRIRWFSRGTASHPLLQGMSHEWDADTIWLSTKLGSWEDVVEVSAHETTHVVGYHDEEVPTLVGRMAAKHWSGEREVYVHLGDLRYNWMPQGVKELPDNAVVLELDNGARTYWNHGTRNHPQWRQVTL